MTDRKTKTSNYKQDSVPKCLKGRAIIPCTGTVVKSCPNGIKQLPSSNELDAQYVSPHQKTKRKNTTPERRVPAWFICRYLMQRCCKVAAKNGGFRTFGMASLERTQHWGPWDNRNSGTTLKRLENSKASCCNLLRWTTKLKCVSSEFQTVDTHPKEGCLKWLHGTMSEPPWKSH